MIQLVAKDLNKSILRYSALVFLHLCYFDVLMVAECF